MASLITRCLARAGAFSKLTYIKRNTQGIWQTGHHHFHSTPLQKTVQPYLLADIGEGITECRIVQWFVKPGDHVKQFDPVCEVQSDKASVEITSRYDGLVKALYHEVDAIASVGKPLIDIEIEDGGAIESRVTVGVKDAPQSNNDLPPGIQQNQEGSPRDDARSGESSPQGRQQDQTLVAVPAVRLLLKRHGIDIRDVPGTGKGGRVTKEDVQRYIERQESSVPAAPVAEQSGATVSDTDATVAMTATEARMFQVMTESLSIPQLGYTHAVDLTTVDRIRRQCNLQTGLASELAGRPPPNLTFLPIIIKAISMAFEHHKRMNSHLKFPSSGSQDPQLTLKQSHDFGIAVDTPHGLFVPVVRGVQRRSIYSIAEEIDRLSILCRQGKIQPADLRGATFMVSNIGSIGGSVIRPILVPPMVAIVALGRVEAIARFGTSAQGTEELVKRQEAMLSWSADHRVLDGASVARCARLVCTILEGFDGVPLAVM